MLASITSCGVVVLAGCGERHRSLSVANIEMTYDGSAYDFTLDVKASSMGGGSRDWKTFHGVELVAKSAEKEPVHTEKIGDIGGAVLQKNDFLRSSRASVSHRM